MDVYAAIKGLPKPFYDDGGGRVVFCADCRELLSMMDKSDVMILDPPYGESHASNWPGKFNGIQIANDDGPFLRDMLLARWGSSRSCAVFGKWSVPKWGRPRGVLVWSKGPASGMGDLQFPWKPSWEDISIYGPGWNGSRDEAVLCGHAVVTWSGNGQRLHPNEKPVSLITAILSKAPKGIVIDPCCGAGSVIMAAKLEGRQAIGIEINERFASLAANRLSQGVLF